MGWIRERILAEHRKHYQVTGGIDWALITEKKIVSQMKELLRNVIYHNEDDTYRFSKKNFNRLWDSLVEKGEEQ